MGALISCLHAGLYYFHEVFNNNWGVAIIALTVFMRVLLFPAQVFQFRQQRLTAALKPDLEALKIQGTSDPLELFRATSALRKKAGIRTGAGILVAVLQLPIFWAMYRLMSKASYLMGISFLWLPSLSASDPFWILPLFVALTTYLQARGVGSSDSARAGGSDSVGAGGAMVQKFLPAMSFAFMITLPSCLVLYYATSGLLQVAGQALLRRISA